MWVRVYINLRQISRYSVNYESRWFLEDLSVLERPSMVGKLAFCLIPGHPSFIVFVRQIHIDYLTVMVSETILVYLHKVY